LIRGDSDVTGFDEGGELSRGVSDECQASSGAWLNALAWQRRWVSIVVADRATRERSSCRTPLSPIVSTVQRVSDHPRDRFVRMGESNTPKLGRAAARLLEQRIISARAVADQALFGGDRRRESQIGPKMQQSLP